MRASNIYRFTSFALWASIAVNVVIAFYVFVRLRRPVNMEIRAVTVGAPRFDTAFPITNYTQSVSQSIINTNNIEETQERIPREYIHPYSVFVVGERFARLSGYDYAVGDMCAYGRIRAIYPERIYLESGDYINNERKEKKLDGSPYF